MQENTVIRCKCHGVTSSCEMKTCWKELVKFSEIGDILKEKYDGASKVRYDRRTGRILKAKSETGYKRNGKRRSTLGRPTVGNLVYVERSPDYCVKSREDKTLGTSGRECKPDTDGHGSCTQLCCGRGFRQNVSIVQQRCQCKFQWCCYVKCKTCNSEQVKNVCL